MRTRLSNKRVVCNKRIGSNLTENLINVLDGIIMLEGNFETLILALMGKVKIFDISKCSLM